MTDCVLCEPAPHPNCEVYAVVTIEDPMLKESSGFEVCLDHYETIREHIQHDN